MGGLSKATVEDIVDKKLATFLEALDERLARRESPQPIFADDLQSELASLKSQVNSLQASLDLTMKENDRLRHKVATLERPSLISTGFPQLSSPVHAPRPATSATPVCPTKGNAETWATKASKINQPLGSR